MPRLYDHQAARIATAVVFFVSGLGYGSWAPRLAEVKDRIGASDSQMGLSLLMLGLGALISMPIVGALANRYGSRVLCIFLALLHGLVFSFIGFAPSWVHLGGAFLAYGMAAGGLDVAMNVQAVAVEQRYGRSIMSSMHGMFSIGGMSGALGVALAAMLGLAIEPHFFLVSAIVLIAGVAASMLMLPQTSEPKGDAPAFALPGRSLLTLGVIAAVAMLAEGSIGDWSAIYLHDFLKASTKTAALAFALFSICMAVGRFAGDGLIDRFGPTRMLQIGSALATIGLAIPLIAHAVPIAMIGYALTGLGLAVLFPVTLQMAARDERMNTGTAIAGVSTVGYGGLLMGPPALGFLADAISLAYALGLVVLLAGFVTFLAIRLDRSTGTHRLPA